MEDLWSEMFSNLPEILLAASKDLHGLISLSIVVVGIVVVILFWKSNHYVKISALLGMFSGFFGFIFVVVTQGNVTEGKNGNGDGEKCQLIPSCNICPDLCLIQAGTFRMGAGEDDPDVDNIREDNERPQHLVVIERAFAVSQNEITLAQFRQFVERTEYLPHAGPCLYVSQTTRDWQSDRPEIGWDRVDFAQSDKHPVTCVSYYDAKAYVNWLNAVDGGGYRLLTESEWEYMARAKTTASRYWGDNLNSACEYANGADETITKSYDGINLTHPCDDGFAQTAPVGSFNHNMFGIYDTLGNVWEWVEDCYHDSYKNAPSNGSAWLEEGCDTKVLRGGSWYTPPWGIRSASRQGQRPDMRHTNFGFRVAKDF